MSPRARVYDARLRIPRKRSGRGRPTRDRESRLGNMEGAIKRKKRHSPATVWSPRMVRLRSIKNSPLRSRMLKNMMNFKLKPKRLRCTTRSRHHTVRVQSMDQVSSSSHTNVSSGLSSTGTVSVTLSVFINKFNYPPPPLPPTRTN